MTERRGFWWTCAETGKRGFSSKKHAKRVARKTDRGRLHTFPCEGCGGYHNGHKSGLTRAEHRAIHEVAA